MPRLLAWIALGLVFLMPQLPVSLTAQTNISGDVVGSVTDSTGAAVTPASVTITSKATGLTKTVAAGGNGEYRFSLLAPGVYTLTATASGFQVTSQTVTVVAGTTAQASLKLSVGQSNTTVEVTGTAALLQTETAEISTNFSMEQIQNLPNPGNDLTYYAQTSPGVVMNTGGGYGNFSVFGLPGTSNNFMINGAQENDPFLNLNNSGPSNLLLGQNDIADVTVVSNAYGAEFGSFGGVQMNEITRSGSNAFHGNATYWYNGSYFNANNWFSNHYGAPKPNTVNNQWALGLGGPIVKDKSFFFLDFEGIRFVTGTPTQVFVPSATYQANALANIAAGGFYGDPGVTQELSYIQQIFNLYNNAAASHGGGVSVDQSDNVYETNPKVSLKEWLVTARYDQQLRADDHLFLHAKYDVGKQPTYSDPLYGAWNDNSYQPEWDGQLVETHTFNPKIANQFLFTAAHYQAIFSSTDYQAAQNLLPYALLWTDVSFYPLNYLDYDFPQGRNVTQYEFQDDFTDTIGTHTLQAGFFLKRDDVSNHDLGIYNNPLLEAFGSDPTDPASSGLCTADLYGPYCLTSGYTYLNRQIFPSGNNESCIGGACTGQAPSNPIAAYNLGVYFEDVWKALPNLTITAGIRFEHNSNPACQKNCFSHLNSDFFSVAANDTSSTPYNSITQYGLHRAFSDYWFYIPEPRISVNWQPAKNTVLRGGFGMFTDVFPAQVTDYLMRNAPQNPRFQNLASYIDPSVEGNGFEINQITNSAFHGSGGFYNGGSYASLYAATGGAFNRPNIYTVDPKIAYPTYEEWNLQLQQQLTQNMSFEIGYVGNHGYHEPVVNNSVNAYLLASNAELGTDFNLPTSRPAPSFGEVINLQSNASSNYNGVTMSIIHRNKLLTTTFNYSYSHTLDMVSNGGFLGFTSSALTGQIDPRNIKYNYGNADYDTRHNITGNYVINVPYFKGPRIATADWVVAGTAFWHSGFPFTVTDGNTTSGLFGAYYAAIPASIVGNPKHHCGRAGLVQGVGCFDISDGQSPYFADATSFHVQERNQFTGPGYFDTDLSVLKGIHLGSEHRLLQIGAQAYNLFNHPNFANPAFDISNQGSGGLGQITGTVGSPTSIYGSGLGGDASVRILQFKANITF